MAGPAVGTEPVVVAVFDDRLTAESAINALTQVGFTGDQIGYVIRSIAATEEDTATEVTETTAARDAVAGMIEGGMIGGILAALVALFIPGIGPVVAGGVLASFFGGALAGTAFGGIVGAMKSLGVPEAAARFYDTHFRQGRAIVTVKAGPRSEEAVQILRRFGGQHIHSETESPVETRGAFSRP